MQNYTSVYLNFAFITKSVLKYQRLLTKFCL